MALPVKINLKIYRGQTFHLRFPLYNEDDELIDASGWTGQIEIKGDPTGTYTGTSSTGQIVTANGSYDIFLTDEVTAALAFDNGLYDVFLEDALGNRYAANRGFVVVFPSSENDFGL
jgi:hypothetical protein